MHSGYVTYGCRDTEKTTAAKMAVVTSFKWQVKSIRLHTVLSSLSTVTHKTVMAIK